MSDYNKITDYAAKDSLSQGDAVKRVKGSEIGADFDAVAVAVATKANSASPVFTGVSGFAVGAVGAPSIYMTGYATTGWYNIGANNWGFAVSGAKVLDIATTGLAVTGTLSATGTAASGIISTLVGSTNFGFRFTASSTGAFEQLLSVGGGEVLALGANHAAVAKISSTGLEVTGLMNISGPIQTGSTSSSIRQMYVYQNSNSGGAGDAALYVREDGTNNIAEFAAAGGATRVIINNTGLEVTGTINATGQAVVYSGTATPAGGTPGFGYLMGSANIQIIWGSGAPTASCAKGSLYLRTDGTTTNNRMYVNTDGNTTWTAVTTVA